jgi:hypothetical protein
MTDVKIHQRSYEREPRHHTASGSLPAALGRHLVWTDGGATASLSSCSYGEEVPNELFAVLGPLTHKGRELRLVLVALRQWGEALLYEPGEEWFSLVDKQAAESGPCTRVKGS